MIKLPSLYSYKKVEKILQLITVFIHSVTFQNFVSGQLRPKSFLVPEVFLNALLELAAESLQAFPVTHWKNRPTSSDASSSCHLPDRSPSVRPRLLRGAFVGAHASPV